MGAFEAHVDDRVKKMRPDRIRHDVYLAGTRRIPLQKIVSRPSRGGRDDRSPTKHERIVDDVGRYEARLTLDSASRLARHCVQSIDTIDGVWRIRLRLA